MTTREKVAHLLRRLGLGASPSELAKYEPLGVKGTLDALLNYDKAPDPFPVDPWEFFFQANGQIQSDPTRVARWWALRLLMTQRPFEEKMTVFWHDHFAVSGSKIESGPMMLGYLNTLRAHASGSFRGLLGAISKDPAMLRWLDTDTSVKGRPNENFAREVLELFTLGIGRYTEKDIQECARAFTGWSLRTTQRGGNAEAQRQQLMAALEQGVPLVASSYSDGYHDEGPKSILGKTAPFDTESTLDLLAARPETAQHLAKKLWEFFAYENPEPKVVERVAGVFARSKGDIRAVVRAIADTPEFWSDKCVRALIKSPLDFTVPIIRQLDLGEKLLEGRALDAKRTTPIPAYVTGVTDIVLGAMRRQGMLLLYPPDVAGWDWGTAWVSPAMMVERERFATYLVGRNRGQGTANAIVAQADRAGAKTTADVADVLISMFDAPCTPEQKAILVQALEKTGGYEAFKKPQGAGLMLAPAMQVLFAMPAFHFC